MKLHFAAHANLVTKFTVSLHDSGIEIPSRADFDFLKDVNAIFAAVAVPALGHMVSLSAVKASGFYIEADTMIDTTYCKHKKIKEVAERVGFEPTVEFPQHTLSKRAP